MSALLTKEELAALPELPLKRLLRLAIKHRVIDEGALESENMVHIYLGSRDLVLTGEEGKAFLRGLIRGYDRASGRVLSNM